jgi:YbgC/YbaW family acyl-CoA thioester hydrolase
VPLIHTRQFRIRSYECDAYGHLYNANYLRLMQDTAFDASAAAGYDPARYAELHSTWLIRATDIEYLLPLRYNDLVEIKTWVADFRRASSRRMYEFRKLDGGALAARASTDWVYLDLTTNRPTTVPTEMGLAFFPEGVPEVFPVREPFPSAPPPPPGVYTTRRRVVWQDIDMLQHVNNAVYLDYVTECGMQVIAAHHWPVERMMTEGFGILVRRNQVQYLQPALLNDELEIRTWFYNPRFSTATRCYQVNRLADGAAIAQVHSLGVWVELKSGRPIRIPKAMLADFAPNGAAG